MGVQFCSSLCSNLLTPDVWGINLNEPTDVGLTADGATRFHPAPKRFSRKGVQNQDIEIVDTVWIGYSGDTFADIRSVNVKPIMKDSITNILRR